MFKLDSWLLFYHMHNVYVAVFRVSHKCNFFMFLQQDKKADLSKKKQGHNWHDSWLRTLQHQTQTSPLIPSVYVKYYIHTVNSI